jgi:hypothetical protein
MTIASVVSRIVRQTVEKRDGVDLSQERKAMFLFPKMEQGLAQEVSRGK